MKGTKPATILSGSITEVPRTPSWLSKEAKAEWKRILPDLVERRILSPADLGSVEELCLIRGRIRELETAIRADPADSRLIRAQNQAITIARQIAAEIGCTPVSRSRPTTRDDSTEDEASPLGM